MKSQEAEVKEIANEKDNTTFGGPLALVSKTNVKDPCFDDEDGENEEGFIVNSDDEVMAYYSNNNVKKFKKIVKENFKNNPFKKTSLT